MVRRGNGWDCHEGRRRYTWFDCYWSSDVFASDVGELRYGQLQWGEIVVGLQCWRNRDNQQSGWRRSEERRVGKECRFRWVAYRFKKRRQVEENRRRLDRD